MKSRLQRRTFLKRVARFATAGSLAAMTGVPRVRALMPAPWALKRRKEVMLDQLSFTDFAPHLGQKFSLKLHSGNTVDVELIEATSLGRKGPRPAHLATREPFCVTFLAPKSARLDQRIYQLAHQAFGKFEIFLVPIGLDERGLKCEAVFN